MHRLFDSWRTTLHRKDISIMRYQVCAWKTKLFVRVLLTFDKLVIELEFVRSPVRLSKTARIIFKFP